MKPDNDSLECLTTLSALSAQTRRIRLGAILCNTFRNPALVAKTAASLDVMSNGRLEMGFSAGWFEEEHNAYGIEFPPPATRVAMLEETIQIVRRMWLEKEATFKGKYAKIVGAVCNPKPIQKPYPPIWIGGAGRMTLKIVAKYADGWNYGLCPSNVYASKLRDLRKACQSNAREFHEIIKALQVIISISKTKISAREKVKHIPDSALRHGNVIVGTPEEVRTELERYLDLGVSYFTPALLSPNIEELELLADEVFKRIQ